jgi:uncharacterized protein (TIGR01777 family)
MKIFITGGLGFIGTHLSEYFLKNGNRVIAVGRPAVQNRILHDRYTYLSADTTKSGAWQNRIAESDVVINLAGKSIFKRWTESYKRQIYDSRILTTRNVVNALEDNKRAILCSTSAVGFYGDRGDEVLNEESSPGNDFLSNLSVDWEKEALEATSGGVRVVIMRFGIILARDGGALSKMIPQFKFFAGGPTGSGEQWFPWMHLEDLMEAVKFSITHSEVEGPLNFCAPEPARNRHLANAIGEVLNRPSIMPAPAFMIRLVLGEFGNVLLGGQRTVPRKLLEYGFKFKYPDIKAALHAIIEERTDAAQ